MAAEHFEGFASDLRRMRRGGSAVQSKPHKLLMLLSVLDLFEQGTLVENRVYYEPGLVSLFIDYFRAVAHPQDWCQPGPPYFHLRSSPFWHLAPKAGHEEELARLSTSGGGSKRILENVDYAYLAPEVFSLFSHSQHRAEIRQYIFETFFPPKEREALGRVAQGHGIVLQYAASLAQNSPPETREVETAIRRAAFRRVVLQAYDYRCAACGLRIERPELASPVDAAHIVPWAETHDDSPQNGIALCKLHHWALDTSLISPTPALKWRVSSLLDRRRDSERELTRLNGLRVMLPRDEQFYPRPDAIAWRLSRLARQNSATAWE